MNTNDDDEIRIIRGLKHDIQYKLIHHFAVTYFPFITDIQPLLLNINYNTNDIGFLSRLSYFSNIVHIDQSPAVIVNAIQHYNENRDIYDKEMQFLDINFLKHMNLQFPLITCIHSLDKYFNCENDITSLLSSISRLLNPNGLFICTFRSGKDILTQTKTLFQPTSCFGNTINQCSLSIIDVNEPLFDSIRSHEEGEDGDREEYLIFINIIIGLASKYQLLPIVDYPTELDSYFNKNDKQSSFKHFNIDHLYFLTKHNHKKISSYGSIVFKKTDIHRY